MVNVKFMQVDKDLNQYYQDGLLCPDALDHVQQCVSKGKPLLDYVPDFTCKVIEDARVLRIKLADFKACIQGKFEQIENNFMQNVPPQRAFSEPVILPNNENTLTLPGYINTNASDYNHSDTDQSVNHKADSSPNRLTYKKKRHNTD
eukprot:57635_1